MTRPNTIVDIDRFFTIDDGCWLWFGSHLFLGTQGDNIRDMIAKNRRNIHGERGSAAKITDAQALLIRTDTRINRIIALDYGVSKGAIAKIKQRRTFRHLP